MHFRQDFIMEANIMNPKGAVRPWSMLFAIKATQEHKQMRKQTTNVMTGEKELTHHSLSILML